MTVVENFPSSYPQPTAEHTDLVALLTGIILNAGERHIGQVGGEQVTPSASFTRPADTTAYASGDLVANSTVANQVTPMSFTVARVAGGSGCVRRLRLRTSSTSVTSAQFRLHLYSALPTQTGGGGATTGDNAAWSTDQSAGYLGSLDVTVDKAFTEGARGDGIPNTGTEIIFVCPSGVSVIYGLLEARAAYQPTSLEIFTATLEVFQN